MPVNRVSDKSNYWKGIKICITIPIIFHRHLRYVHICYNLNRNIPNLLFFVWNQNEVNKPKGLQYYAAQFHNNFNCSYKILVQIQLFFLADLIFCKVIYKLRQSRNYWATYTWKICAIRKRKKKLSTHFLISHGLFCRTICWNLIVKSYIALQNLQNKSVDFTTRCRKNSSWISCFL